MGRDAFLYRCYSTALIGCLLLALLSTIACAAQQPTSVVRIALKSKATVADHVVNIGHIAEIRGGDAAVRQQINDLDIADPPAVAQEDRILRAQIAIRLQLAGIDSDSYRIDGPNVVEVTRADGGLSDASILSAIRTALARQLQRAPDDVELRLAQPLTSRATFAGGNVHLEPYLPTSITSGRMTIRVAVHVDGRLREIVPVAVQAHIVQEVARAAQQIERGEAFSEDNVSLQRQRMVPYDAERTALDVFGKVARRTIRAGDVIQSHHVNGKQDDEEAILIRPRDTVRMVARKGSMTVVVPAAEALQQGRQGDLIRVRNPQSKKVITGRVVSRTEVEIAF